MPTTLPQSRTIAGLTRLLVRDGRPLLSLCALVLLFAGLYSRSSSRCAANSFRTISHFSESRPRSYVPSTNAASFISWFTIASRSAVPSLPSPWCICGSSRVRSDAASDGVGTCSCGSGAVGFVSFLAYLGYGYLDSWHGSRDRHPGPTVRRGASTLTHRSDRVGSNRTTPGSQDRRG